LPRLISISIYAVWIFLICIYFSIQASVYANDLPGYREKLVDYFSKDSLPKTNDVTVIIPFEYKQSTLFAPSIFHLLDSVAGILAANDLITFSILGYSYFDEGNDYVCYWLSHDRADAVKSYIIGRGIDSSRLLLTEGRSSLRSRLLYARSARVDYHHTAEIILNYPIPKPAPTIADTDGDGIADTEDSCATVYGYPELNGCPNKNAIIPFEPGESYLSAGTYRVMDSLVNILRKDSRIVISIEGHAYKTECVETICERMAAERADIVKRYLLSRLIAASRIKEVKSMGKARPLNAGRNPEEIARNSRAEVYLHN